MNADFTVQTDIFEGPFSALLDLIEKHKLSINEVSLSSITDEYIAYVQNAQNTSMSDISGFIVVAATLMLIKSKSLLPGLDVTEEEKGEIEVLEKRLEVFQIVKAISGFVREQYGKSILYRRPFVRIRKKIFVPSSSLTSEFMMNQIIGVLQNIPRETELPETRVKKTINLEEVLASLLLRIQKEAQFIFSDFTKTASAGVSNIREIKTFVVVTFLAVLEMVKNGTLEANQEGDFGDITIGSYNSHTL